MASWGLLAGFGRGLSQGSEHLARGLAEEREAERQRMREESIEKRWKRQESREDARNKVADERYADQLERQKTQDNLTKEESEAQRKYREDTLALQREELGVKISERRRAEIEGTLGGIQRDYEKSASAVERRHERLIDAAKQLDQQNGFAKDKNGYTETDRAYIARDEALASLSKEFTAKMVPIVRSYGSELKGTAYSSYLDDVKTEESRAGDNAGKQFLRDAGVIDGEGKFTEQQPQAKQSGRGDLVNQIVGSGREAAGAGSVAAPSANAPDPQGFGFLNNMARSYDAVTSDQYNGVPLHQALPAAYSDLSGRHTSPVGHVVAPFGGAVGLLGGFVANAADGVGGVFRSAFETPAQRDARLNPPPPIPGETPQQYAARTGIKR